jgi:hypothetical protein
MRIGPIRHKETLMMVKDMVVTAGVASATMLGVLVFATPTLVDAVGEGGKPGFVVNGVNFTVETVDTDAQPTARIVAMNTTGERIEIDGTVRLMAQDIAERESRMGPMSREAWSTPQLFVLAPHETKTWLIHATKPMPKRTLGRFILKAESQAVGTAQFKPKFAAPDTQLAAKTPATQKTKKSMKSRRPALARLAE